MTYDLVHDVVTKISVRFFAVSTRDLFDNYLVRSTAGFSDQKGSPGSGIM